MSNHRFSWALPIMSLGYTGRGLVYVAVAGLSLWAIWRGGSASGTEGTFATLEASVWGEVLLYVIGAGLLAYALWRLIAGLFDLEAQGSDGTGIIARLGQVTTGILHGVIGIGAVATAFRAGHSAPGDTSTIDAATAWVMDLPAGHVIVGIAGLLTLGAGIYYLHKGWSEGYRRHLNANDLTRNWNWVLKAGVLSQGVIIVIIGGFLVYAALTSDPSEAGGLGQAFAFLREQVFGQILVILICIGLLFFAVFCFVNATHRHVPGIREEGPTLMEQLSKS